MPTRFDSSPGAGRRTTGATPSCCWTCCGARRFPSCPGPLRAGRTPWRCPALAVCDTLGLVPGSDRARRTAAYGRLDPSEHASGDTTRYGHISKQGNRLLRFLLVEAAWSAVQHEEDLGRFFRRLRARKKPHAVAVVAVARKLVLRLYRMLQEGIDYEEFRRRGRDARRARQCASPAQRG